MSGTISFQTIPNTLRVPNVYLEFDASQANSGAVNQRSMIVAQMLPTGTATPGIPVLCMGVGDAQDQCGMGSMMASMVSAYRAADIEGELWMLPLSDNVASTKGSSTATVTGTAATSGTLSLYVNGTLVEVGVHAGDTAATVATNTAAAINHFPQLPVTAAAALGAVTITATQAGVSAGDIDVRANFYGARNSEYMPDGLSVAVTHTAGTGDPDPTAITAALANVAENMAVDFLVWPYTGAAALKCMEDWFNDVSGRWSYISEMFGGGFAAYKGTAATLTTWGKGNNNQHLSVLGYYDSPTPAYLVASDYCATCAVSLRADPALPLQNIFLHTMLAPPLQSRFDFSERETLLYSGISTFRVDDAGQIILERSCTTWQTNAAGAPDNAYLDTETPYTLMAYARSLRIDLQTKYSRKKLVDDSFIIPFGSSMVTAKLIKGEVIAHYRAMAATGLVQNVDSFVKNVRAENAGNGRVNVLAPVDVANQLRIIAVSVQFRKS